MDGCDVDRPLANPRRARRRKWALREAGRGRDWNCESFKAHIHRVVDRRAHGIAAGSGGVCKGGRYVGAEITAFRISDDGRCVGISGRVRACRLNGGAAGAFFHGMVQTSDEKERHSIPRALIFYSTIGAYRRRTRASLFHTIFLSVFRLH